MQAEKRFSQKANDLIFAEKCLGGDLTVPKRISQIAESQATTSLDGEERAFFRKNKVVCLLEIRCLLKKSVSGQSG